VSSASTGRRITREELRGSFSAEKAAHDGLLSSRFYRQISFFVTPWFMNAGISANTVTGLAILICIAMPPVALLLGSHAYLGVAAFCLAYLVLDCVDGNIARVSGSSSQMGQYLDSTAGKLYAITRTVALGIVAGYELPAVGMGGWLAVSLAAALLFVWGRESRQYFKITTGGAADHFVAGSGRFKDIVLAFTELIPLGLLVLGPARLAWLVFVALCAFYTALFAYSQVRIIRKLQS
jgi:phosphatidylglycerophosphate synthase